MPSYDELLGIEQSIRDVLAGGAEAELRALPGVVHVSVGLKERAGRVTREHAIRVYVTEKRPADDIAPADRIPAEVAGIPTDVNVVGGYGFTVDSTRYRPILGGIQISNRIIDVKDDMSGTQMSRGTLGCVATLDSDRSPVLLSNWHVLLANSARTGDRVYQPAPSSIPPVDLADLPLRPTDDADAVGKIAKYAISAKVDGAVARIDVSSCCRCCGIDFRREINGLSVGGRPPSNGVAGQRPAVSGMTVYKVGMQTGRTAGRVVDPSFPTFDITSRGTTYTFTGQIQIASDDPAARFSRKGDSGSVVVDGDGFVVGLLFGANDADPPDDRSMANHISDVCTELGITIEAAPSSPTAGARIAVPGAAMRTATELATAVPTTAVPDAVPGATELTAAAPAPAMSAGAAETYQRLRRHPAGAWLLDLAKAHRAEVVHLVNHDRRVMVAWHRAHGPAFLATVANTLRDGGDELPTTVQGVSLDAALERMGSVLTAHGSAALREAVEEHGPALREAVRGSGTLGELLAALNTAALHPTGGGRP